SVVSTFVIETPKPEFRSVATAEARSKLVTSGTAAVVGPFETPSVTVDPRGCSVFAPGSIPTTVPFGSFESTSRFATANPAACSWDAACSYGRPSTDGTATGLTPCEMLILTVVPWTTFEPGFGASAITVPAGSDEWISTGWNFSPTDASAAAASADDLPRTSGPVVLGFPVDTSIVTG